MSNIREKIQNYIAAGQVDEALVLLKNHAMGKDTDLESQVIMLSGQYAQFKRDQRFGLGAKPEVLNRIRLAILGIAGELEKDSPVINIPEPPVNNGPSKEKGSDSKLLPPSSGIIKILFTAANPDDTTRIRIGEESREIENGLRMGNQRDRFMLIQKHATRKTDLRRALLNEAPTIVHFSGHGLKEGIILETDDGGSVFVNPEQLGSLFELFKDSVHCVILNSCYSKEQAVALAEHIPYVIGMRQAMPDKAAIQFSVGFYDALAAGKDYEFAFKMGVTNIELQGKGGEHIPEMIGFDYDKGNGFSF